MKQILNHFNSHQFLNENSLSVFILILTVLLTACGGSSSENTTTGKVVETVKAKSEVNESLKVAKIKESLGKLKYQKVVI